MTMPKFSLDPLLNHRKYAEEMLQKELADSKRLLDQEKQQLRTYQKEKDKYRIHLQQKQKSGSPISEISLYITYMGRLSADIERQQKRVLKARKKFGQKRIQVMEAMKKRKVLEKLKAKELKRNQQELQKKDQIVMNEIAVNQYNRKK